MHAKIREQMLWSTNNHQPKSTTRAAGWRRLAFRLPDGLLGDGEGERASTMTWLLNQGSSSRLSTQQDDVFADAVDSPTMHGTTTTKTPPILHHTKSLKDSLRMHKIVVYSDSNSAVLSSLLLGCWTCQMTCDDDRVLGWLATKQESRSSYGRRAGRPGGGQQPKRAEPPGRRLQRQR